MRPRLSRLAICHQPKRDLKMEKELIVAMSKILGVIFPMLLAWLSSNVVYHFSKKETGGIDISLNKIRYFVEKVVLSIFLPLVFMFSILKTEIKPVHLILLILGFFLPLLTMLLGMAFRAFSSEQKEPFSYWKPFLPATFGGGNRGTLLVILLSPFIIDWLKLNIITHEIISYFAIFDLGNFIFLMLVIRKLAMPIYAKTQLKIETNDEALQDVGEKGSISDIFKWLPGCAVLVGLLPYLLGKIGILVYLKSIPLIEIFSKSVIGYSSHLSSTFAFLTFLSIFILFKEASSGIDLGDWTKYIITGLIARAIGILIVSLALYFSFKGLEILTSTSQLYASIICPVIFLILPPSSLFSLFVGEIDAKLAVSERPQHPDVFGKYTGQLSSLVKSTNYIYLAIMLFAAAVAFFRVF